MSRILLMFGAVVAALSIVAVPACAQATRTWVSGVGDDVNPCSRTAPCKTFAGAISKTAASGEISVLDPGGFGSVTITKAISIIATGVEGSVLASGTTGILINAGVGDNVSIRGLTLEGGGSGTAGIRVIQANNVYISDTFIHGFKGSGGYGIDIESTNGLRVYMKHVEINGNLIGVNMHAGSTATGLVIDDCTVTGNATSSGIFDTGTSVVRVLGSSFANTSIVLSNGASLTSEGNNFFNGGAPAGTVTSPLQ